MPPQNQKACFGAVGVVLLLLLVVLLPFSLSYLEYYEYGLVQRKTTGKVDFSRVYDNGRYLVGPDKRFLKYQADAHLVELDQLSVFSSGGNESIGLEFRIDVDFTFFLIEDEIDDLHRELASNYRNIIVSRARDAIKNEAIFVTFQEYFQERQAVEDRFRKAVEERWVVPPSLHCSLDQFHMGRIEIPDSVASKQLQQNIQTELNDREKFLQQAEIERELTNVEINAIRLERVRILWLLLLLSFVCGTW